MQWRPLRARVADLHRRADGSPNAHDRYCTALARVDDTTTRGELTGPLGKRVRWHGRPARALHPFECGDLALLTAVGRGEFTINGFRNPDLRTLLFGTPASNHRLAAILPPSAANFACSALTASFKSCLILTAITSRLTADS